MYKCIYCGKEFEKHQSLSAHIGHCKMNPNCKRTTESMSESAKKSRMTYIKEHPEKYIKNEYTFVCKKCGKEYTLSLTEQDYNKGKYSKYCSISCRNSHTLSDDIKQKISDGISRSSKHYVEYKTYYCKYCGKPFTIKDERDCGGRQYCSEDCRTKWLEENFYFNKQRGFGKSGWYKGIHCDSSWELAFVIYHLDNNIPIKRCKTYFEYQYENNTYRYYPDFETPDGIIEIKGFQNLKWFSKKNQIKDIKVLYKEDMKPYLNYVISKYGKNFINLYDN